MYFPSEEERRYVLRKLLPEARRHPVAEELRGWNWHQPPLAPVYEARLGVSEIAGRYCPTGRDVYLRRVMGVKRPPNPLMVEGAALHELLARMVVEAKRTIYNHGAQCLSRLEGLREIELPDRRDVALPEAAVDNLRTLREYEWHRIVGRVQEVLTRQPWAGPDAVVALALPVVVEQRLDGTFLGLSTHLSADAFLFSELVLADVKFGPKEEFHRLSTTGYALVLESLYECPINVGCLVYGTFRNGRLTIERDFHIIGDELRQWFIEERDERMRMVQEKIDPGLPAECYQWCQYLSVCRPK